MRHFALRVGAETADQLGRLKEKLDQLILALGTICTEKLNLACDEVTALEAGAVISDDTEIETVLKSIHHTLVDLDLSFPFYIAAGYTNDAGFGCLTYTNNTLRRIEIPAPETLTFFEQCLHDLYLEQGEDQSTAQSFAEADAGDYLNQFRDFLQERIAVAVLTGRDEQINSELDKATRSKLAMEPLVRQFLNETGLLVFTA